MKSGSAIGLRRERADVCRFSDPGMPVDCIASAWALALHSGGPRLGNWDSVCGPLDSAPASPHTGRM